MPAVLWSWKLQAAPWLPSQARVLFMVSQLMLKMVTVIFGMPVATMLTFEAVRPSNRPECFVDSTSPLNMAL